MRHLFFYICLLSFTFILEGSSRTNLFVQTALVKTGLRGRVFANKVVLSEGDTRLDFLKKACFSWGIAEKIAVDFELWSQGKKVSFVDQFEVWKADVISLGLSSAFMQKCQANPTPNSVFFASLQHQSRKIKYNTGDSPTIIKDRIRSSFDIDDRRKIYYKKTSPINGRLNLKILTAIHPSYY